MQNEPAITFIDQQRKNGRTDEEIRGMLISRNWPLGIINQLLSTNQTNSSSPSQEVPIPSPEPVILTEHTSDQKPKKIHYISVFFFIITCLYTGYSINGFGIFVILDKTIEQSMSFTLIKHYPILALSCVVASFMSIVFFYTAFKVREGSRFSFWLALSTVIIFPTTVALYVLFVVQPFIMQLINGGLKFDEGLTPGQVSAPIDYVSLVLLFIPTIILLLSSYKNFHFDQKPISKKAKIWLSIFFLIIVIPITGYIGFKILQPEDTDFGYTKAQAAVAYHVYRPYGAYLGLTPSVKFHVQKLGTLSGAVGAVYDVPFNELLKGSPPRFIALKEVGVDVGFDLDSFAKTLMKNPTNIYHIDLPIGKNHTAIIIEKKYPKSTFHNMVFMTEDNVLIYLITNEFSVDELLQFTQTFH